MASKAIAWKNFPTMFVQVGKNLDSKTGESEESAPQVAAREGFDELTRLLLKKGADMTEMDINGETALHLASRNRQRCIVRVLLEKGMDVNTRDRCGYTALHAASKYGRYEFTKPLLKHGADHEARCNNNDTPLLSAAHGDQKQVLQLLIAQS
jgi:ankyrin repeat protein